MNVAVPGAGAPSGGKPSSKGRGIGSAGGSRTPSQFLEGQIGKLFWGFAWKDSGRWDPCKVRSKVSQTLVKVLSKAKQTPVKSLRLEEFAAILAA